MVCQEQKEGNGFKGCCPFCLYLHLLTENIITDMQGKKFISPGAWFSIVYPELWSEFEDTESSFLFYNPDEWSGNFRISAYKRTEKSGAMPFGEEFVGDELKNNRLAAPVKLGKLACAYSKEMFEEEGNYYVNHLWVTGIGEVGFECTFTVAKGSETKAAEEIISSLEVREEGRKYPAEIIPVRVSEISEVNESYDLVVSAVKKQFKKDFQGVEGDLPKIQQLIESGTFPPKQKEAWIALGIAACVILANEVDGMEWMTLIDGNREAPVLQYRESGVTIDPMSLVWSKVKRSQPCDIVAGYKQIIENL